jgi:uncharacterized membrane protein (DUF373 family)
MDSDVPRGVDDEGLPMPPPLGERGQALVRWLGYGENAVFMAIAVVLFGIALATLVVTVHDLAWPPDHEPFAQTITRALNGVLFIVIALEVLRTIVVRFEGGGFQLQPFLVIGIISAVRHILTVGAQLSLVGEQLPLVRTMTELAVNAGVVLALSVALVLVRRFARLGARP